MNTFENVAFRGKALSLRRFFNNILSATGCIAIGLYLFDLFEKIAI
jgi:hypothetical protein